MPPKLIARALVTTTLFSSFAVAAPENSVMHPRRILPSLPAKDQRLLDAFKIGPSAVRDALRDGADPNASLNTITPLRRIIVDEHIPKAQALEIIEILLDSGARITDDVLWSLAYHPNIKIIDLFIKHGWDVDAPMDYEEYGQVTLLSRVDPKFAEALIQRGANVNGISGQQVTPLIIKAHLDDIAGMKLLLKHGARVRQQDFELLVPAANAGNASLLHDLLAKGINVKLPQARRFFPLHTACNPFAYDSTPAGRFKCAEILLNAGVSPNAYNEAGITPLMLAVKEGLQPDLVALLLRHGANPKTKGRDWPEEQTLWNYAAPTEYIPPDIWREQQAALLQKNPNYIDLVDGADPDRDLRVQRQESTRTLELLLQAGLPVESRDRAGTTPLMLCAARNRVKSVQFLLKHGASLRATDSTGNTALHYAAQADAAEAIPILIKAGGNLEAKTQSGYTPLHVACGMPIKAVATDGDRLPSFSEFVKQRAVNALLDAGAAPDSPDRDGETALMQAVKVGMVDLARPLLAKGANPVKKNKQGMSPADLAAIPQTTPTSPYRGVPRRLKQHEQFLESTAAEDKRVSDAREVLLQLFRQ